MTYPLPPGPIPGAGSRSTTIQRASGDWFIPVGSETSSTVAFLSNNTIRVLPWLADSSFTLSAIGTEVTVAGDAGCTMRPVIYSDSNGTPNALLLDAGPSLAGDAVAFPIVSGLSLPINAGVMYWIGAILQGAPSVSPTVRYPNIHTYPFTVRYGNTAPVGSSTPVGYAVGGISGAAPATYPLPVALGNFGYRLWFKVA